jgi:hypothetical protein
MSSHVFWSLPGAGTTVAWTRPCDFLTSNDDPLTSGCLPLMGSSDPDDDDFGPFLAGGWNCTLSSGEFGDPCNVLGYAITIQGWEHRMEFTPDEFDDPCLTVETEVHHPYFSILDNCGGFCNWALVSPDLDTFENPEVPGSPSSPFTCRTAWLIGPVTLVECGDPVEEIEIGPFSVDFQFRTHALCFSGNPDFGVINVGIEGMVHYRIEVWSQDLTTFDYTYVSSTIGATPITPAGDGNETAVISGTGIAPPSTINEARYVRIVIEKFVP